MVLLGLLALVVTSAAPGPPSPPPPPPVMSTCPPGVAHGKLSQPAGSHSDIPFLNNPDSGCVGKQNQSCPFVDTCHECYMGCKSNPGCTAWSMFYSVNTGPVRGKRTKHSCQLMNLTAQDNDGDVSPEANGLLVISERFYEVRSIACVLT